MEIIDGVTLIDNIVSSIPQDLRKYAEFLQQELKDTTSKQESLNQSAANWLVWARHHKHVGVVSVDVPPGVLPGHCTAKIHDAKVVCNRGPDDAIYDKYKDIRDKVARGNCFLEVVDGEHAGIRCLIYAQKKFTGGLGDDDDREDGDDSTWKRYFIKPLDSTSLVVATRKANGEAAHLSALFVEGQFIICAGSKNVHILFKDKADIEKYVGSRYAVATEICEAVLDCLNSMEEEQKQRLLSFMCVMRYTAMMEILVPSHQHVEDLSHLNKPLLQFICWTNSDLETKNLSLCSMAPDLAIEIARCLGLPTVEYSMIPVSLVESRMAMVRQEYGYEGEVFYFLDESRFVIGLLKKKTVWYIICRAIREKSRWACRTMEKSANTFTVSKACERVQQRLQEIQTWLGLDDSVTEQWKTLGVGFVKWSLHKTQQQELSIENVSIMFPVHWKQYLSDTDQSDKINVSNIKQTPLADVQHDGDVNNDTQHAEQACSY